MLRNALAPLIDSARVIKEAFGTAIYLIARGRAKEALPLIRSATNFLFFCTAMLLVLMACIGGVIAAALAYFPSFFSYIPSVNYLYFFSTLAQTLGALLGFTGIFIVFRIEAINIIMRRVRKELPAIMAPYYIPLKTFEEIMTISKNEIRLLDEKKQTAYRENVEQASQLIAEYEQAVEAKARLLRSFLNQIISIASIICASLLLIPLVPDSGKSPSIKFQVFTFFCRSDFYWL